MGVEDAAQKDARRIAKACLGRIEEQLQNADLSVRDLLAAAKEARALLDALETGQPPPPQSFELILRVEGE